MIKASTESRRGMRNDPHEKVFRLKIEFIFAESFSYSSRVTVDVYKASAYVVERVDKIVFRDFMMAAKCVGDDKLGKLQIGLN